MSALFGRYRIEVSGSPTERVRREARAAARLRGQPHIVTVDDVVEDDTGVWLVLDHVPSRSLHGRLEETGPLTVSAAARVCADVADALGTAHRAGIRHCDVRPGNVLLGDDGVAWLAGFGMPRATDGPSITAGGPTGGETTEKVDIFALGATLYTAVEGRPPFGIESGAADPPRNAGPLEPLLRQMMSHDPDARPDAMTVRDRLYAIAALTPPCALPGCQRTTSRRWDKTSVVGLVAICVVIVIVAVVVSVAVAALGG